MNIAKSYETQTDEALYHITLSVEELGFLDYLVHEGRRYLLTSDPADALIEVFGIEFADESARVDS